MNDNIKDYLRLHQLNKACDAFLDIASPSQEEAFWKLYTTGQQIIVDPMHYNLNGFNNDYIDSDSFYMIYGYNNKSVSLISCKQLKKDLTQILAN